MCRIWGGTKRSFSNSADVCACNYTQLHVFQHSRDPGDTCKSCEHVCDAARNRHARAPHSRSRCNIASHWRCMALGFIVGLQARTKDQNQGKLGFPIAVRSSSCCVALSALHDSTVAVRSASTRQASATCIAKQHTHAPWLNCRKRQGTAAIRLERCRQVGSNVAASKRWNHWWAARLVRPGHRA